MKTLSLFILLLGLSVQSAFASCDETEYTGRVSFVNISGACDTTEDNKVIAAMKMLAKADAQQNADWKMVYFNGAQIVSDFTVKCQQEGLVAKVYATARFIGKSCQE